MHQITSRCRQLQPVLALIKSVPGNVSLESMHAETRKLRAARAIGLPGDLFAHVAPRVLAGRRARVTVESPSRLRRLGHQSQRYIRRYTNPPEDIAAG